MTRLEENGYYGAFFGLYHMGVQIWACAAVVLAVSNMQKYLSYSMLCENMSAAHSQV